MVLKFLKIVKKKTKKACPKKIIWYNNSRCSFVRYAATVL